MFCVSRGPGNLFQDACQYWPKDAGTSLTTGPYTLKHKATLSLSNSLTTYVIIVEKKVFKYINITFTRFHHWYADFVQVLLLSKEVDLSNTWFLTPTVVVM